MEELYKKHAKEQRKQDETIKASIECCWFTKWEQDCKREREPECERERKQGLEHGLKSGRAQGQQQGQHAPQPAIRVQDIDAGRAARPQDQQAAQAQAVRDAVQEQDAARPAVDNHRQLFLMVQWLGPLPVHKWRKKALVNN